MCMRRRYVPPTRGSMTTSSQRATAGPSHSHQDFVIQASNTRPGGASKRRESSSDNSVPAMAALVMGRSLVALEVTFEPVEAVAPEPAVEIEPFAGAFEAARVEAAAAVLAVALAADKRRRFKHAQVTRDRRLRDGKGLGEFADRGLALRQPREDGAAHGIGQSGEGGVELFHRSEEHTSE